MEYLLYVKVSAMIYLFCQSFNNSSFFSQFTYSLSCFFFPSLFLSPTIQKFLPVRKFIICLLFTTIDLVCGNDVAMDLFSCICICALHIYISVSVSVTHSVGFMITVVNYRVILKEFIFKSTWNFL